MSGATPQCAAQDTAAADGGGGVRELESPLPLLLLRVQGLLLPVRSPLTFPRTAWRFCVAPFSAHACTTPRHGVCSQRTSDFLRRDPERDVDLTTVIFNAFRERYHKIAGSVLGNDRSEDAGDFRQKLTQEEAHRARHATLPARLNTLIAWARSHGLFGTRPLQPVAEANWCAVYEGALTAAHNVQAWKFDHAVSSATFQEKGW